ncbi:MAG: hypothetical protein IJ249_07095 [Paludibacteraceae bacterium]|nr:hypothetical protein [Paludibacteraceae bacterium]
MSKILIIGYFLGQQADKKRDSDVRNGNEMVTGMEAKYMQKIYKIPILLAYVKKKYYLCIRKRTKTALLKVERPLLFKVESGIFKS